MSTTMDRYCAELGISYRRLDYWCTKGYVRPVEANPGNGNAREFTNHERAVLARMADLVNGGMTPSAAGAQARRELTAGMSVPDLALAWAAGRGEAT